ncbi:hypothetical protein DWF04_013380 [Cereibacter sphaeroides f. sp. denitrificans]
MPKRQNIIEREAPFGMIFICEALVILSGSAGVFLSLPADKLQNIVWFEVPQGTPFLSYGLGVVSVAAGIGLLILSLLDYARVPLGWKRLGLVALLMAFLAAGGCFVINYYLVGQV